MPGLTSHAQGHLLSHLHTTAQHTKYSVPPHLSCYVRQGQRQMTDGPGSRAHHRRHLAPHSEPLRVCARAVALAIRPLPSRRRGTSHVVCGRLAAFKYGTANTREVAFYAPAMRLKDLILISVLTVTPGHQRFAPPPAVRSSLPELYFLADPQPSTPPLHVIV